MNPKEYLKYLFKEALDEMSPEKVVQKNLFRPQEDTLKIEDLSFNIQDRPLYIFAVGKAAIAMASAVSNILGDQISDLLVIAPDNIEIPGSFRLKVVFGTHPVPTQKSLEAGKEASSFFKHIPDNALLICLISGGTSSLMCLPANSLSISDLNRTYQLLINSGATIHEINAVRKHCSQIKGGQLLRNLNPGVSLINLVISDVPDDDLQSIGSGPTIPDTSTFQDAYHVLLELELWDEVPVSVKKHIEKGLTGEVRETLVREENPLKEHHSFVISSAHMLAETAAKIAEQDGYNIWVSDKAFKENVEEVAHNIAEKAKSVLKGNSEISLPALLFFYGESTVQVTGSGKGGRNQELALHGALKIAGSEQITWLSAGTDGVDGPTDAAGAVIDGKTIQKAKEIGLDPEEYLLNNDSYHFHEKLGTLFKTEPTGNNLMDLVLILIKEAGR